MAVVYQHRRKDTNDVFYVGVGISKNRAYITNGRNSHWKTIVKKVGYEIDILIEGCSWEDACEIEKNLISCYGRYDLGLGALANQTDGGEGNVRLSPEKNKLKGEKISKSKLGKPNLKLRGRAFSEEHKNNIRLSNIGKKYSEEVNKKKGRSIEQSGSNNHMYNKIYITDGINNRTIHKHESIPDGWKKGRTLSQIRRNNSISSKKNK
jgi:hypothetical protein